MKEVDFERDVVTNAERIFGTTAIYIDIKKRISGNKILSIPDGYVIDVTEPHDPKLFVIENEIVRHDPYRHIGIQMLRFLRSYDGAKQTIRNTLMEEIASNKVNLQKLKNAAKRAGSRNIDAYLDKAVFRDFRGIVVIDEAQDELRQVLDGIKAIISVIEFKRLKATDGSIIYQYGTLYGEIDDIYEAEPKVSRTSPELRAQRHARRASSDTVIVPAREDGFKRVFLGENQWHSIRIGAAMLDRIKYIAAYQIKPVKAVTYMAEVNEIKPYKDSGKYILIFSGPAKKIKPIRMKNAKNSPQGPVYVKRDNLLKSKYLEDALTATD